MNPQDERPETRAFNTGGLAKAQPNPPPPPTPLTPETIQRILEVIAEHKKATQQEEG